MLLDIAENGVEALSLCEPATSLCLVRLVTSLRVACRGGRPVKTELRACERFFTSREAHELARQFQEAKGVQVLVELVLRRRSVEAVRALLALSQLGRSLKESIYESEGVSSVIAAVLASGGDDAKRARLDDAASALLVELSFGNPTYEDSVRNGLLCLLASEERAVRLVAARSINAAISRDSPSFSPSVVQGYTVVFVPTILRMLVDDDFRLGTEAHTLLKNLLPVAANRPPIVGGLVEVLNRRNDAGRRAAVGESERDKALEAAKLSACDLLLGMVTASADPAERRATVALMAEKNVPTVLLRLLTESAAVTPTRSAIASDLVRYAVDLLSALYDRDSNEGEIQQLLQRCLRPDAALLPMLVCAPERFHNELMLDADLAALLRREFKRTKREARLEAQRRAQFPQTGGPSFFLTTSNDLEIGQEGADGRDRDRVFPRDDADDDDDDDDTEDTEEDARLVDGGGQPEDPEEEEETRPAASVIRRFRRKDEAKGKEWRLSARGLDCCAAAARPPPPRDHAPARRRSQLAPARRGRTLGLFQGLIPPLFGRSASSELLIGAAAATCAPAPQQELRNS